MGVRRVIERRFRRLHAEDKLSPTAIARRLGIARSSVYRFLPGADATSPSGIEGTVDP